MRFENMAKDSSASHSVAYHIGEMSRMILKAKRVHASRPHVVCLSSLLIGKRNGSALGFRTETRTFQKEKRR